MILAPAMWRSRRKAVGSSSRPVLGYKMCLNRVSLAASISTKSATYPPITWPALSRSLPRYDTWLADSRIPWSHCRSPSVMSGPHLVISEKVCFQNLH